MTCSDDFHLKNCSLGSLAEEYNYGDLCDSESDLANDAPGYLNNSSDEDSLVEFILEGMDMHKYYKNFKNVNICLDTFLNVKNSDLIAIGITDEDDRNIILKNLESHRRNTDKYLMVENHYEDLIIAKNILNQLAFMEKYVALVEYKWTKKKYIDFEGNETHPPARNLQILTHRSLVLCKNMLNLVLGTENSDHLIGNLLKMYKITAPKFIREKFDSMQRKKRIKFFTTTLMSFLGVSTLTYLSVKCFREMKKACS